MTELYKQYRPAKLMQIIGQPKAVSMLKKWVEKETIPHAMLFSGPSGCGKTTAARIMATKLGCIPQDVHEMNAANFRGIDEIRAIDRDMRRSPLGGTNHVWIVDECHQLTKVAQDSFLKPLEDTPSWVYFILCSSEPLKLKKAIRTRCSKVNFRLLPDKEIEKLVKDVLTKEKKKAGPDVLEKVVEFASGSAREALVLLDQIVDLEDDEAMVDALVSSRTESKSEKLSAALLEKNPSWKKVAEILKDIEDEPETVRHMVLRYMNKVVLSCSPAMGRANTAISFFRDNFYDCGNAGLTNACFEMVHSK